MGLLNHQEVTQIPIFIMGATVRPELTTSRDWLTIETNTLDRDHINTSQHVPLVTTIPTRLALTTRIDKAISICPRIKWDKVDLQLYQTTLQVNLQTINNTLEEENTCSLPLVTQMFIEIVASSAEQCGPRKIIKPQKLRQENGHQILYLLSKIVSTTLKSGKKQDVQGT